MIAAHDSLIGGAVNLEMAAELEDVLSGVELRVFTRDGGARIRFISDGADPGPAAVLFDTSLYETQEEADRVARACDDFLRKSHRSADDEGWHPVPRDTPCSRFVPNLLRAARNKVWSDPSSVTRLAIETSPLLPADLATAGKPRRRWSHADDVYFALLVGLGYTAKAISAELDITVWNAHKRAQRLGLSLTENQHHETRLRLPPDVMATAESRARASNLRRETYLNRYVTKAMRGDPDRFGTLMV